ncbi:hypothetical protein V2J09_023432 [Rumex salicifolius]
MTDCEEEREGDLRTPKLIERRKKVEHFRREEENRSKKLGRYYGKRLHVGIKQIGQSYDRRPNAFIDFARRRVIKSTAPIGSPSASTIPGPSPSRKSAATTRAITPSQKSTTKVYKPSQKQIATTRAITPFQKSNAKPPSTSQLNSFNPGAKSSSNTPISQQVAF